MTIENLLGTMWLTRYPWPKEIMFDQEDEFTGNNFKNRSIEYKYGIKAKPDSSWNPQTKSITERIN